MPLAAIFTVLMGVMIIFAPDDHDETETHQEETDPARETKQKSAAPKKITKRKTTKGKTA